MRQRHGHRVNGQIWLAGRLGVDMKAIFLMLGLAGAMGGIYLATKPASADGGGGGGNTGPKLVALGDLVIS